MKALSLLSSLVATLALAPIAQSQAAKLVTDLNRITTAKDSNPLPATSSKAGEVARD